MTVEVWAHRVKDNAARSWWKDKGLRFCMWNILALYCSLFALGYDSSFISIIQSNPSFLRSASHSALLSILTTPTDSIISPPVLNWV